MFPSLADGTMLQICRYCGIIFSLILRRTSSCVHERKTNRHSSVKYNHVIYSGMTTCFGLKRPSSGHHYKNFKRRYNTPQLMDNIPFFLIFLRLYDHAS